jgi:hypothetical protein
MHLDEIVLREFEVMQRLRDPNLMLPMILFMNAHQKMRVALELGCSTWRVAKRFDQFLVTEIEGETVRRGAASLVLFKGAGVDASISACFVALALLRFLECSPTLESTELNGCK